MIAAFMIFASAVNVGARAADGTAPLADSSWPDPLRAPFDVAAARAAGGKAATPKPCKEPPPPVADLTFGGYYAADTNSSVVDQTKMAAYKAATRPIEAFEKEIVARSDAYVRSRPAAPAEAACALAWLARWADGGAFLGKVSDQGGYNRKWSLATAAAAYLKIRDEPSLEPRSRAAVTAWLGRLARVVRDDYSTGTDRTSRRNNHLNWAAWAVAAAAVATNDRDLLSWAVERYRFALGQVDADGFLPLEIARRARALHYHLFALAPLVMIAETGARNGIDLYEALDGALHRLVGATLAALDDPSVIARRAGYTQEPMENGPSSGEIAWMEVYGARYPEPRIERWRTAKRPLADSRTGGDLTLLFAKPPSPAK